MVFLTEKASSSSTGQDNFMPLIHHVEKELLQRVHLYHGHAVTKLPLNAFKCL